MAAPKMTPEQLAELKVREVKGVQRIIAHSGGGYFPTLIKLQDGSLGAVVRGGAGHVGVISRLDWIRSWDGGQTWNFESTIVPGTPEWDNRGSSAGQMIDPRTKNGAIVVGYWECYAYHGPVFDYWSDKPTKCFFTYSIDNGHTWTKKEKLDAHPACSTVNLYGRIISTPQGLAMMPAYGGLRGKPGCRSILLRSRNRGRTWGDPSVIAENSNEVSLALLKDGTMLAVMRCDTEKPDKWGGLSVARSTDEGRTWSEPVEITRSNQHPGDILELQSGTILVTYGNRIGDLAVGAVLSRDGGKTFDTDHRMILARNTLQMRDKNAGDIGYPSTVQLDDGTIVTVYYRLGHDGLTPEQQERCRQYERDTFGQNAPASQEMRAFEQLVCLRYTEKQLLAK
jgi:hypothetical protein